MVKYLVDAKKRRWISDRIVEGWFKNNGYGNQNLYNQPLEFIERYILYRIEDWKRRDKVDQLSFKEFPRTRNRVLNSSKLGDEDAAASLGNLTFCWGGESIPKDADFDEKKEFLKDHGNDTLILNNDIRDVGKWWTNSEIEKRETELLEIFLDIWKGEEKFLNNTASWRGLETDYPVGSVIPGKIVDIGRYGAAFQVKPGVQGWIRCEEMAWTQRSHIDPKEYVNEDDIINAKVLEVSEEKQRFFLSIKQTQPDPLVGLSKKHKDGTVVKGKVNNIVHYGVFVQLQEEITGLVHITELAYPRPNRPEEIVSVGEELNLKVIRVDMEKREIGFSLKAVMHDPWVKAPEKYKVGTVVQGKIVRFSLKPHGAFAKLEKGVEGLVHISELADRWVEKPGDIVSIDDELDLKVIKVDREKRHIDLSLKAVVKEPRRKPSPRKHPVKKETTTPFGKSFKKAIRTKNTNKSKN